MHTKIDKGPGPKNTDEINMWFQSIFKEFSFYIIVGYCFWRLLSICTTFSKYI